MYVIVNYVSFVCLFRDEASSAALSSLCLQSVEGCDRASFGKFVHYYRLLNEAVLRARTELDSLLLLSG